jgi:hypothetical protein
MVFNVNEFGYELTRFIIKILFVIIYRAGSTLRDSTNARLILYALSESPTQLASQKS